MIDIQDLHRSFGNVHAVNGLNLEIKRGEVFGFLGPNGSGKTTTLHLTLGLIKPDRGSVRVFGLDPMEQGQEVRNRCGVLLEHEGLYERSSVLDNLLYSGRQYGLSALEAKTRAREVLEELELWDRRHDKSGTWSRGMKRRLAVGRAFLHTPELVFLDEPTSGFDPKAAHDLRAFMQRLAKKERTTVFMTTHNMHEAERTCDRVAVVRAGKVLSSGAPNSLTQSNTKIHVMGEKLTPLMPLLNKRTDILGVESTDDGLRLTLKNEKAAPLVKFIVQKGAEVEQVIRENGNLESAFLELLEEP